MRSTGRDIEFTVAEGFPFSYLRWAMRPDNPAEEPEGVMASDNQGLMGVPLMLGLVYGFHALAMILT